MTQLEKLLNQLKEEAQEEISCGNSKEKAYGRGILYAIQSLSNLKIKSNDTKTKRRRYQNL